MVVLVEGWRVSLGRGLHCSVVVLLGRQGVHVDWYEAFQDQGKLLAEEVEGHSLERWLDM